MPKALCETLREEIRILSELTAIGRNICSLGDADEEKLSEALLRRESLLEKLAEAESSVSRALLLEPAYERAKELAREVRSLSGELEAVEDACKSHLESLLQSVKEEVGGVARSRKTLHTYAGTHNHLSRFTDRKG